MRRAPLVPCGLLFRRADRHLARQGVFVWGNPEQTVYAFHSRQWHRWSQNNGKSYEGNTSNVNNRTLRMESEYGWYLQHDNIHCAQLCSMIECIASQLGSDNHLFVIRWLLNLWVFTCAPLHFSAQEQQTHKHTYKGQQHTHLSSLLHSHTLWFFRGLGKKTLGKMSIFGEEKKRTKWNLKKNKRKMSEVKNT